MERYYTRALLINRDDLIKQSSDKEAKDIEYRDTKLETRKLMLLADLVIFVSNGQFKILKDRKR